MNARVKSTHDLHSANHGVTDMVHFLRVGVGLRREFRVSEIIQSLENRRVAADVRVSRCFSDLEMEAMMRVASKNPLHFLMLVLLREVGLRISALAHLRFCDFYDEHKRPREVCSVHEKAGSVRHFVPSCNVLDALAKLQNWNLGANIFPTSRSAISCALKHIAKEAEVKTPMHAHAFRHTLVGKLLAVGNSMEMVSKFMGHKSTHTTEKFYYMTTVKELHASMTNPFSEEFQKKRKTEDWDLQIASAKKQKLLQLVKFYDAVIAGCVREGLSAQDVQKKIATHIPLLPEVLRKLDG
jgi:hypothetical protein